MKVVQVMKAIQIMKAVQIKEVMKGAKVKKLNSPNQEVLSHETRTRAEG